MHFSVFQDASNLRSHCMRKHKVKLPSASARRRLIGKELLNNDVELIKALLNECLDKSPSETTTCVICKGTFGLRHNLFAHAKKIHNKDFSMLIKEGAKRAGISLRDRGFESADILRPRITIKEEKSSSGGDASAIVSGATQGEDLSEHVRGVVEHLLKSGEGVEVDNDDVEHQGAPHRIINILHKAHQETGLAGQVVQVEEVQQVTEEDEQIGDRIQVQLILDENNPIESEIIEHVTL